MTKHYRLSPSSMNRILACPGSLQHDAEQVESGYMAEGTEAHGVAADLTAALITGTAELKTWPVGEMFDAAKVFADRCASFVVGSCEYAIEKTIESTAIANFGGTSDFYCVTDNGERLVVVDFKYGAGHPVAAEKNPQLLSYASLLTERFPRLTTYVLEIVQPRTAGEAVDTWECTRAEVDAHTERVKAAAARSDYSAGEHCKWCPVVASCDHLAARAVELASGEFATEAAADRWPEILRLAPALQALLAAIPGKMLAAMRKGVTFPGFKAVKATPGHRAWIHDEAATLKALAKKKIGKRQACKSVLLSPAQLDKAGYGDAIVGLVERPDRGISLAPASDKRPAVVFATADETFDDLSFLE